MKPSARGRLSLESVTEKETGNAQPCACVDVLPRCWLTIISGYGALQAEHCNADRTKWNTFNRSLLGAGNGKEWTKATDCSAPKLMHSLSGCINYLSAGCPTISILSRLPRFCFQISNPDQYTILIILIPEHKIDYIINWNWYSKN